MTIKNAKKILTKICEDNRYHDKDIMQGVKGEERHGLEVLRWVEELKPRPSLSMRLAALFHDIDRVVTPKMGGGFKGNRTSKAYLEHKKMHAKRSADFIIPILQKHGLDKNNLERTNFLIIHHDDTRKEIERFNDSDLNYLVAADCFAFFTSITVRLLRVEGEERLKGKTRFIVGKLSDSLRIRLWEYQLEDDYFNNLKNEVIREYYLKNSPREREYKFCPTCAEKLKRERIDGRKRLSCPKCGFIFWNNPKPCVSVIIEKEGNVLLIKRAYDPLKDYWCLPGGFIESDERPEDAVTRETKEEINLDIKIKRLVGVYQIDNDPRGTSIDIIYFGFITGNPPRLSREHSEYKFFSPNELPRLIAYKHREAMDDWHKGF